MKLNIIWNDKKVLALAILAFIFIASGIISPILVKNRKDNWGNILNKRIHSAEALIKNTINDKINYLLEANKIIEGKIRNDLDVNKNSLQYDDLPSPDNYGLLVELFNPDNNLIYWRNEQAENDFNLEHNINEAGQAIFIGNSLKTYLIVFDTLKMSGRTYKLLTGLPVERHYRLSSNDNKALNLSDSLSLLLSTSVKIIYDSGASLSRDGRTHSFAVLNNYNNKIAVVDYEKPALDNDILELENSLNAVQSIILLLLYFVLFWIIYDKVKKSGSRTVRFISFLLFIVLLRLILFFGGFPSSFVNNELTDASNFSSTFAFGIVRSPLELAITVILGFLIILVGFRAFLNYYDDDTKENKSWIKFIIVSVVGFFLILLTIRGLGASLRSVVFDSSIRYFKEFNLIPNPPTFLMDFNILVAGFSSILFGLTVLMFILLLIPKKNARKPYSLFIILFFTLQLLGEIFDTFQKQPQGTPLIRILFITILFILAFLLVFRNYRSIIKFLYIALGASIATVSLLTYYNSEIERESLKTTAQDLTRSNENIYRFMVFQTLAAIQNNPEIKAAYSKNENMNSVAFIEWTKSLLYRETIPAFIMFYDSNGKKLGSFSTAGFNEHLAKIPNIDSAKDEPEVQMIPSVFGDEINIFGNVSIKKDNVVLGYVGVGLIYDRSYFNFVNVPKFLFAERSGISSAVDLEQLKIFYFHNGILDKSFGSAQLSENDVKTITNVKFSRHNEAWLELNLAGESYLFYILDVDPGNSKILAVAKEEKNFSWNLSDFFKVFFVHTLIILAAAIIIALWNYRRLKIFLSSYRTKLAAAFVVVSVIPLILIAVYFKVITEEKNTDMISNRLGTMANQVENYLKLYSTQSSVQSEIICDKAVEDLGINFSVYGNKNIIYSSTPDFYNAGLLPDIVPFKTWYNLFGRGLTKTFEPKKLEGQDYYAIYLKMNTGEQLEIIEVNSQFNRISLPLSDLEVDIFMFGVFSLALIMLIVFSTILAEQISSPIRRLTSATRSLGSGDLNIEVEGNYSGEIAELTSGFNMMVKQLRKSQAEMALLERETAWKEMAKQVAHEIKNPLTPMKLSVQQLIAAYRDKSPKFDSIFEKVTSTIITQVENLKNIASEFSNFARMPKLNIERMNLIDSIKEAVNLFSNEKLEIKFECGDIEIAINADHDHLNRTFINLIRNSIQAKAKKLLINVSTDNEHCLIRVIDDGSGISSENIDKVFEESFTTKTEGMGLGLSMTKRFLESINGKIIVEKSSANGTVFLITIPLAE